MKIARARILVKYKPIYTCHYCKVEAEGDRYQEAESDNLDTVANFVKGIRLVPLAMPVGWASFGLTKVRPDGSKYMDTVFDCGCNRR